jgi:hypothetical protein
MPNQAPDKLDVQFQEVPALWSVCRDGKLVQLDARAAGAWLTPLANAKL